MKYARALIVLFSLLLSGLSVGQFADEPSEEDPLGEPLRERAKGRRNPQNRAVNRKPMQPPAQQDGAPGLPMNAKNTSVAARPAAIQPTATGAPASTPNSAGPSGPRPGEKPGKEPVKVERAGKSYVQGLSAPTGLELSDLVKLMSNWKKRNFIYDEKIKGKIFIVGPFEVSLDEAYQAFLSAMEVKGFTVVDVGRITKIVYTREARQNPTPFNTDAEIPDGEQIITQLIPVKNTSATEIQRVIQPLVSKDALINVYALTNTLIVTDNGANLRRIVDLINKIDVAGQSNVLEIVPLKYANCVELTDKLKLIYPDKAKQQAGGASAPQIPNPPPTPPGGAAPASPSGSGESGDTDVVSISQIIPYERTNALIVMGTPRGLASLKSLLIELDVEDTGMGPKAKFYVYRLEHANADTLSQTLQTLITGSTANKDPNAAKNKKNRNAKTPPVPNQPNAPATPGGSSDSAEFEGDVKVVADPPTNSLVITAAPSDYATLLALIKMLDVKRKQVFVEALLMEVTAGEDDNFGTTYNYITDKINNKATTFGGKTSATLNALSLSPSALTGLALGFRTKDNLALPAGVGGADLEVPLISALINASAKSNNVNILSTPHILTTDNEEALIKVGQKVPFVSGRFSDLNNQPMFQYSREDVGITLKVKPQVSSKDYVSLELEVEISEVLATSDAGVTTSNRTTKSTVVVRDQQTVVAGGLMSQKDLDNEEKVPLLGDIPIIGWLFKNITKSKSKTNLLIFLTPYVISDTADLNDVFFRKIKQRQEFIEKHELEDSDEFQGLKDRGQQMLIDEAKEKEEEAAKGNDHAQDGGEVKSQPSVGDASGDKVVPPTTKAVPAGDATNDASLVPAQGLSKESTSASTVSPSPAPLSSDPSSDPSRDPSGDISAPQPIVIPDEPRKE